MQIQMVAVGKLKEAWLRDAFLEYSKRLKRFCRFSLVEIDEARLPESPSEAEILAALKQEGQVILSQARGSLLAMCIEGETLDSVQFAKYLEQLAISGESTVSFAIGSSFGLHTSVKNQAVRCLSLSRMTFPHQLARVLLMEQIYRAFQIEAGGKYHK